MKKFITIALAIAVLFSFAACQQTPTYRNAEYITINQLEDFVVGQPFDASKFEVEVTYTDGTTGTIPGKNIVTPVTTGEGSASKWSYGVKASLTTASTSKGTNSLEANYTVVPYAVEDMTITLPELVVYEDEGAWAKTVVEPADGSWDDALSSMTVSVTYDGGKTMEISAADAIAITNFGAFVVRETDITVDETYDVVIRTKDDPVKYIATNLTATGIETPEEEMPAGATLTGIGAVIADKTGIFAGDTIGELQLVVTGVYSDGENSYQKVLTDADGTIEFKDYVDGYVVNSTLSGVVVRFTPNGSTRTYDAAGITVTPLTDYATGVSVALNGEQEFVSGGTIADDDFTYTVTSWASGKKATGSETLTATTDVKVTTTSIKNGFTGNLPVAFEAQYATYNGDKVSFTGVTSVNVVAEATK